ncbi:hypothetical protein N9W89_13120 [Hellea sp.]|nr:hypothetical protein [Hellea sp.]
MVNFKDLEEVHTWLRDQSQETCTVFATRWASRTLPNLALLFEQQEKENVVSHIILTAFVSLSALMWPKNLYAVRTLTAMKKELFSQMHLFKHANDQYLCLDSIHSAISTAQVTQYSDWAVSAGVEFLNLFEKTEAAFSNHGSDLEVIGLSLISSDATRYENGLSLVELLENPLWIDMNFELPPGHQELWETLKESLLLRDRNWEVWINWYEDRIKGYPLIKDIEINEPKNSRFGRATFPIKNYAEPALINHKIKKLIDEFSAQHENASETIAQIPGAYAFSANNGKIQARSLKYSPENNELAQTAMEELAFIAENAVKTLSANHADGLMSSLVERFLNSLPEKVTELKSGLLMMQITSLDGFIEAFSHPDNEQEKNLLGALLALRKSADAFQGMFPELQKVQANQLALELQNTDVDEINKNLDEISTFAKQSKFVGVSAVKALESGAEELSVLNKKLDITYNLDQRATLIETQARVTAHRVVNNRNFFAKALDEAKDITGGVYGAAKKGLNKGVEGAVAGSIKGGLALLVASLVGPIAGLAVLIASFAPIDKKSKEIESSIEEGFTEL